MLGTMDLTVSNRIWNNGTPHYKRPSRATVRAITFLEGIACVYSELALRAQLWVGYLAFIISRREMFETRAAP